ncbi:uncharacterized protein UV8b_04068 [Ustilaginoidea virens]|uniref:Uncharacterized protein n=1 Tax=Ustilaginoidea virens TaxID=1159556 RepID=A0A063CB43_USTVR|nr:uncharacterized protein UV8b_04068 [Ustilaginoidea virens]QUC19827.1 hypothetical protein UV8b_04068 [Ustilaginoidea virens]GAO14831.1 hypothetical protein UVI_02005580 [Ustilaginoidea virens]
MAANPWDMTATIKQSPPVDVSQPYDASTMDNKTILVTGGANGLGSHMVRAWASRGANIIIGDVDDRAGEALVADLRSLYPSRAFAHVHCDVTSWDDQTRLFEAAVRSSPSSTVDIVVPNAGIIQASDSFAFENPRPPRDGGKLPKPSTKTIDVNVTGVIYTTHLALSHFSSSPNAARDKRDRCLLLVGSVASIYPLAGQAHYTMSKHAVCGLFRSLRMTAPLHHRGVRVNMLAPYFVERSRMLPKAADIAFLAGTAGGATVADVVDAATRLVADESISGRCLAVGPRLRHAPPGELPVAPHEGAGQGRAAWEVYAHDYEEVDAFTRRYIRCMNAVTQLRGVLGWLVDVCRKLLGS